MDKKLLSAIADYERYIEYNGINDDVIDAYMMACDVAFSEKDIESGLKISARTKELIEQFVREKTGGTVWQLEKHAFQNKEKYEIIEKWYSVLKHEAQNKILDSYLLYLEKNREPRERFYAPKRKQFQKFGLIEAYQGMIDDLHDVLCISMPPGTGKALSMDSKVLTPNGFVRNGDLKVGDKVITPSGKESTILGVYPQGVKPLYDVYFDDGSKCRCSEDHLWTVQSRSDRIKSRSHKGKKYRTIELKEIMKNIRIENGKRLNYSVDYVGKIDFPEKDYLIHPYVMGVLLGDGGLSQAGIRLSTSDMEVLDKVNSLLPNSYKFKHIAKYDYGLRSDREINIINKKLIEYGLKGKRSHEKFIPIEYMYGSYNQRLELLRGLMDTDGFASKCGNCSQYSTSSSVLADNVAEIAHSLGGYASISVSNGRYKKNGEYIECKKCYTVTIQFSAKMENIFSLPRKAERFKPKRETIKRFIKKVEYAGDEECQCIYIDDESHLYITDDYIITHNTTLLKFFNSAIIGWFPRDYNLFYSHSGDITRMYYDGVLQMVTDSDEYTWNEIFPDLGVTNTNAKLGQFNVGKYKPFPSLQTTSVGAENAGKVRASKFLLVDDMIGKLEEALNKNILEKQWGAYTVDARQRKTMDYDNKPCKEIIQATRWSTIDVIGRIIQMYSGNQRVKVIKMPDVDPITGESNFDYEYGGFTKEFFADQQLLMDDISYRCLYKQEPVEREGLLYHEDELRRYSSLPNREPDAIIGVCDTKSKGIDYMVLTCFYQYDNDFYLVDCVCDNSADFGMQHTKLSNIILDHNMQQCEFESNAGGDRLAHEINKIVEEKGGRCNITTKATETNKETRIIVNSDWVKKHCLFREKEDYKAKSDYGEFMSQMISYSIAGRNVHDDVVDCLANFSLFIARKNRISRKSNIIVGGLF